MKPHVAILGGNYAGLVCALALPARHFSVTVIDRSSHFEWLPNIHELLSGAKTTQHLRLSRAKLLQHAGHTFLQDSVDAIIADQQQVRLKRGGPLRFDCGVVALGGVHNTSGVSGADRHAMAFKSVADCDAIRQRLDRLDDTAKPFSIVIVGGGIEGVEALGELLVRYANSGHVSISLVDAADRLLPSTPPEIDALIKAQCPAQRIQFYHQRRVQTVAADAVLLDDGQRLHSDLTIWTGGIKPNPLCINSGLDHQNGWLTTNTYLQSTSHRSVFVAGDAALPPQHPAKQAYHALDMGRQVARNLQRLKQQRPLQAFKPAPKPMIVTFGERQTFILGKQWSLASPAASAAKELIYALGLGSLRWQAGFGERVQQIRNLVTSGSAIAQRQLPPSQWLRTLQATQVLHHVRSSSR